MYSLKNKGAPGSVMELSQGLKEITNLKKSLTLAMGSGYIPSS